MPAFKKRLYETDGQRRHAAYLRSQTWSRRKSLYAATHLKVCTICRTTRGQFNLHHRSYFHSGAGEEPDSDLCYLCKRCHILVHEIASVGSYSIDTAVDYLARAFDPPAFHDEPEDSHPTDNDVLSILFGLDRK